MDHTSHLSASFVKSAEAPGVSCIAGIIALIPDFEYKIWLYLSPVILPYPSSFVPLQN